MARARRRSPAAQIGRSVNALLCAAVALTATLYTAWRLGEAHRNALITPGTPAFVEMTTDADIEALIKEHEQLRLAAYEGAGGHWLIGYGHKATAEAGMTIDEAAAEALFEADLREIESLLKKRITQPIRRREFSAFVDLAYNVGPTAVGRSTALERFNAGDRQGAADALLAWNKITVDGEKVENANLSLRRARARAHFLGQSIEGAEPEIRLARQAD